MFKKLAAILLFLTIFTVPAFAAKTTFSDGNPALGIKGTKVTAAFLNAVNKHYCTGLDVDGDCSLAYATATGTNDLVTTITPTTAFPAAYVTGMPLYIKTAATNTGAMTINVNGLGIKAIKKEGTTALVAGDVRSGAVITVAYDGTNFQLGSTPNADTVDGKNPGSASGVATLDANTRLIEAANTVWDGTAGRSASPTPTANTIPVRDATKNLLDRNSNPLYGLPTVISSTASTVDCGTVTAGDVLYVNFWINGSIASGTSEGDFWIAKSSGSATIQTYTMFGTTGSIALPSYYAGSGRSTNKFAVSGSGPIRVTGSGTLVLTYSVSSYGTAPTWTNTQWIIYQWVKQ